MCTIGKMDLAFHIAIIFHEVTRRSSSLFAPTLVALVLIWISAARSMMGRPCYPPLWSASIVQLASVLCLWRFGQVACSTPHTWLFSLLKPRENASARHSKAFHLPGIPCWRHLSSSRASCKVFKAAHTHFRGLLTISLTGLQRVHFRITQRRRSHIIDGRTSGTPCSRARRSWECRSTSPC